MRIFSSILGIIATLADYILGRKNDKDLKKAELSKRDEEIRNENEEIVNMAADSGDLDDIRKRASR